MIRNLLSRTFWAACALLPLEKNAVLFSSYGGKGYSDSPKAIARALLDSGENVRLYWLVNGEKEAASLPEGVIAVDQNNSFARIKAYSTSKVWVSNARLYVSRKRKGQFYLQTWHGFALKMIEADAAGALPEHYLATCRRDAALTDAVACGSGFMEGLFRRSFWYPETVEILPTGTPRNDIFFRDSSEIPGKVRSLLGLDPHRKLALYAPTFRSDHSTDVYALDPVAVKKACEARFGGEWSVLIRLHPNIASRSRGLFAYDGESIVDATAYPDMQELLRGVEMLITDYSSSMFDFALGGKPCVQFALDIEEYKKDRNFYLPIDDLPFPLARSRDALEEAIRTYDEALWSRRWQEFAARPDIALMEDGKAADRCAQWILGKLGIRN